MNCTHPTKRAAISSGSKDNKVGYISCQRMARAISIGTTKRKKNGFLFGPDNAFFPVSLHPTRELKYFFYCFSLGKSVIFVHGFTMLRNRCIVLTYRSEYDSSVDKYISTSIPTCLVFRKKNQTFNMTVIYHVII